jgi:hypothetical protein
VSGHDPLALAEWQRVRRYAVPARMIAECTEARERGDWRAACEAGRIDVTDLGAATVHAVHLAPDLLRWHLPRALGGDTTLAVDRRYVLIPGEGTLGPDTSVLTVDSPVSVFGSQRLTLGAARWADLSAGRVMPLPAYLWDARYAGALRAAVGGSAERLPGFSAGGEALPGDALGAADGLPGRVERARLAPTPAEAFAEAGFVIDDGASVDWPRYDQGAVMRTVDPVRLHHVILSLAERTGEPAWTLWADLAWRFDVDGDRVRAGRRSPSRGPSASTQGLPIVHTDLARHPVDLELVRAGRITPADLHPLVRAALFPAPAAEPAPPAPSAASLTPSSPTSPVPSVPGSPVPSSLASATPSSVASSAPSSPVPSVPGSPAPASPVSAVPFPAVLLAPSSAVAPGTDGVAEPVRARCRGQWHEIGVRLGRLDLRSHTEAEQRRERALRAFGGEVTGCFAVEQAWHGATGRLPRRMRAHREDLWQRMIHGGTRTVFELLDAGMDPQLRDGRGRTLMHRVRSFDHARLLPRLLADGLDVNARDKEGSTPLYLAVVHRWPADLIIALADAGADPHLANQGDMSVIEHFDEILDYYEDLPADFEAAVAYLRKRA